MKKQKLASKLRLDRETLVPLTDSVLDGVGGGASVPATTLPLSPWCVQSLTNCAACK